MKKCFFFSIIFLLNIFFVLLVYINIKEKIKYKSFEKSNSINKNLLYNRILKSNNKEELDKKEFFKKQFNISICSIDEIQKDLNSTLDKITSNMENEKNKNLIKNYSLLIQKNYFLLNLIENKFFGNLYSNNSLDAIKLYDSFEELVTKNLSNFNYSNLTDLNINFYKGKNLTTNKDLIIIEIKYLNSEKNIFVFSYIDDIIIDIDTYKNLLKVKLLNSNLNNEEFKDNDNCTTSIKIVFKSQSKSFKIKKGNHSEYLTIYSIDNYDNYLICISNCLKYNLLIKFKKEYKDLFADLFATLLINLFDYKTKDSHPFVRDGDKQLSSFLIISAIINSIYYFYFMVNINLNKISTHSFSYEILFGIMFGYSLFYFGVELLLFYFSFYEKISLILKLEFLSGILFSIIYFFAISSFVGTCIEADWKEMKEKKRTFLYILSMIMVIGVNIAIYILQFQTCLFIYPCIMLGYQIIKNIIFDNKHIYPLFYCIYFTIEQLIFSQLMEMNSIPGTLLVSFIEIIILYLQGFYGPRAIFGSKCKGKNNTIYRSTYELLSEKPNSKDDFCSICLLPFFNIKNNNINNEKDNNNKNNNTEANIIKETNIDNINNNVPKENSENNNNNKNNNNDINNKKNNASNNNSNNNNCINMNNIFDDLELGKKNNIELIVKNKNKNCRLKKFFKMLIKIVGFIFWDFYFNETKFLRKYSLLPCGHIFHSKCINAWINTEKKCPICRQEIKNI